jgi:hypothetical protein
MTFYVFALTKELFRNNRACGGVHITAIADRPRGRLLLHHGAFTIERQTSFSPADFYFDQVGLGYFSYNPRMVNQEIEWLGS